ncbi:MAG: RtcB family protein, partial [bacterium]|nr:RtcB family protein [bacterium]
MTAVKKIDRFTYEIPAHHRMLVPGRIFSSEELLEKIGQDGSIRQVENVAHLPGIIGYSLAMPDMHQGYG